MNVHKINAIEDYCQYGEDLHELSVVPMGVPHCTGVAPALEVHGMFVPCVDNNELRMPYLDILFLERPP